jgi:hypothetical protein
MASRKPQRIVLSCLCHDNPMRTHIPSASVEGEPLASRWNWQRPSRLSHQSVIIGEQYDERFFDDFSRCLGISSAAEAKGCIKGAVVGGMAGHMAGHGKLDAAAGCAVGH